MKIEQKIEYIPSSEGQGDNLKDSFSVAMPAPTDPMFKRWAGPPKDSKN